MADLVTNKRWDGSHSIYAQVWYSTSTSNTAVTLTMGPLTVCPDCGWENDQWAFRYYTTNNGGQTNISNAVSYNYKYFDGWTQVLGQQARAFARKTSSYTVTLYVGFQTAWSSWYSGTVNITIPALPHYAVSFNGNGATSGSTGGQTKYYGINLTLNANGFSKTGYNFIGWNTNSSATSASYGNQATYTGNAALSLYALWRKTIAISYDANGGSGAPGASVGYAYNNVTSTAITLSNTVPTRVGYTTDGWAASATGGKVYNKNTSYTFSNSTTIYAHWNPITYNISYDLAGGSLPSGQTNPLTYNIETNTFTLVEPTRPYYEFIGWTGSNGNTPTKNLSIPKGSIDNRNYMANWRSTWDAPNINLAVVRRASATVNDDPSGEQLYIEFTWTSGVDTTDPNNPVSKNPTSYVMKVDGSDGSSKTKTYSMPSTSPVTRKYSSADITLETTITYTITFTVKTTNYPDVVINDFVSEAYFIIDINEDGTAIGFGRPAEDIGFFDCNFKMRTLDNSAIFRAIFDIMHPVGSWYPTSLRPKKSSGETGTNMVDYFDPAEAWGGSWELLEEGIVLTSAGTHYTISSGTAKDGGETTHSHSTGNVTLDLTQIPSHNHGEGGSTGSFNIRRTAGAITTDGYSGIVSNGGDASSTYGITIHSNSYNMQKVNINAKHTHTSNGGGQAHNHGDTGNSSNMQPYKNAYWWHRTA